MSHGMAQERIRFGLVTRSARLEPGENVRIDANSHGFLLRTIKLTNLSAAPVEYLRSIGKINIRVLFSSDGANVPFLLSC